MAIKYWPKKIAIYLMSKIKRSFYYPWAAVGKILTDAAFFSRSRLQNFVDQDSEIERV